jgi:protocatechuate 3,4-dioxygenase beta subunit
MSREAFRRKFTRYRLLMVTPRPTTFDRRQALRLAGLAALGATAAACADDSSSAASGNSSTTGRGSTTTSGASGAASGCTLTPTQAEGPYYLDDDLVRADITEGRQGEPLSLMLTVVAADGCAPLADVAVDIWQTDADGVYSGFDQDNGTEEVDARGETFCRGTQVTGADGTVSFTTIVPGWYGGRVPHLHVKVRPDDSTEATTQLYFPAPMIDSVYSEEPYAARGADPTSVSDDAVLNGDSSEMDTLTLAASGDPDGTGYSADFTIAITQ